MLTIKKRKVAGSSSLHEVKKTQINQDKKSTKEEHPVLTKSNSARGLDKIDPKKKNRQFIQISKCRRENFYTTKRRR